MTTHQTTHAKPIDPIADESAVQRATVPDSPDALADTEPPPAEVSPLAYEPEHHARPVAVAVPGDA